MNSDGISLFAAIVSVLSFLVSLATFLIEKSYARKKLTIDAYLQLQSALFFLYEYKKNEMEDFVTDYDSQEYKALSNSLAQIEIFATAIQNRIYDFKIFYKIGNGYINRTLRSKIEYLLKMKNPTGKTEYYQNTMKLLYKMDSKNQKENNHLH